MTKCTLLIMFLIALAAVLVPYLYADECALHVLVVDTSECKCLKPIGFDDFNCIGSGGKLYYYRCEGDCDACEECTWSDEWVEVPASATPTCVDTGEMPPGPVCDDNDDCEIMGWTMTNGWIPVCACKSLGTPT